MVGQFFEAECLCPPVYALADATRSDSSSDRVLSARLLHQIGTRLAEEWRSDGRRPRLC